MSTNLNTPTCNLKLQMLYIDLFFSKENSLGICSARSLEMYATNNCQQT